jgi:hypothetical protein
MAETNEEKNELEIKGLDELEKEALTPEKRKELMEKAIASLRNPQPIPEDEKDDIFVNYR